MMGIAVIVAVLILLATGTVFYVNYRNRPLRSIGSRSEEIIRLRFTQRDRLQVDNLLDRAGLHGRLRPRAKKLVERLSAAIEVDPGLIRLEDRVSDLVAVNKDELGPEHLKLWDEEGLDERVGDTVYLFAQDVFEVLMKTYRRPEWKALWAHVPEDKRPRKEGDWLALIKDRSIRDLIDLFEKGDTAAR